MYDRRGDRVSKGPTPRPAACALVMGLACQPAFAAVPFPLQAQDVPVQDAFEVHARSTEGFTRIAGVRELLDGRVVLVDSHERSVLILTPDLSGSERVSGHGEGPGEYLAPTDLFPLEGDRSAVYDFARSGFLVVSPDGSAEGPLRPHRAPGIGAPRRMDRAGAFYATGLPAGPGSEGEFQGVDSSAVQRLRPGAQGWDTVAFIPVARNRPTAARDRMPLSPRYAYAVGADGTVGVVRPDPYRVRLELPGGTRRQGPPVPYEPVRVSEAHKEEWRRRQAEPRPTVVGVRGQEGTHVRMSVWPVREPATWPETLPPYLDGAVRFAPDGTLWVARTIPVGDPAAFDVFDRDGVLDRRVRLPAGSRLVGFGEGSVFVVQRDDFDLEYLVRLRFRHEPLRVP